MYATLTYLTIDEDQAPAAARVFTDRILPELGALPGFIAGYWVDPERGKGFGFMLFESEEQARRAEPDHFDWSAPGVEITGTHVRRIAAAIS